MTLDLVNPSDLGVPQREAGGDNEVPRTKKGQPRIVVTCWHCKGAGKMTSEKTGKPIKCKGDCGPRKDDPDTATLKVGQRLKAYTRTTTFIDVLDDKSNLMTWQNRMTLIGTAMDPSLIDGVLDYRDSLLSAEKAGDKDALKKAKDWLNRRAEAARKIAGAEDKADKGTFLHGLSEQIDSGEDMPAESISVDDILDIHAYAEATQPHLKIRHMEQLVVNDEYTVAGTPDRVSEARHEDDPCMIAPCGYQFQPGELLITDLKTGSVEYGALKMAMQLATYSHSKLYDKTTGARVSMDNLSTRWGLIMHSPAGQGVTTVYWADLELGWRAVQLAWTVREIRKEGVKSALTAGWTTALSS